MGFPGNSVVKNLPANAGDTGSIPGMGRSPGEGNGNPLQYSCLGNPMDRGAWRAAVHGVCKELDTTEGLNTTTTTSKPHAEKEKSRIWHWSQADIRSAGNCQVSAVFDRWAPSSVINAATPPRGEDAGKRILWSDYFTALSTPDWVGAWEWPFVNSHSWF